MTTTEADGTLRWRKLSARTENLRTKPRYDQSISRRGCAVWGGLGRAEAGVSLRRMARRLIVRLFADTVRYGEALELQARSFAFSRPVLQAPPGAHSRSLTSPSRFLPRRAGVHRVRPPGGHGRRHALSATGPSRLVTRTATAPARHPRTESRSAVADRVPHLASSTIVSLTYRLGSNQNALHSTTTCSPSASVRTSATS